MVPRSNDSFFEITAVGGGYHASSDELRETRKATSDDFGLELDSVELSVSDSEERKSDLSKESCRAPELNKISNKETAKVSPDNPKTLNATSLTKAKPIPNKVGFYNTAKVLPDNDINSGSHNINEIRTPSPVSRLPSSPSTLAAPKNVLPLKNRKVVSRESNTI